MIEKERKKKDKLPRVVFQRQEIMYHGKNCKMKLGDYMM